MKSGAKHSLPTLETITGGGMTGRIPTKKERNETAIFIANHKAEYKAKNKIISIKKIAK